MKFRRWISEQDLEGFYDREITIELLLHRSRSMREVDLETDKTIEIIIPDEKVDFTDEDIPF